MNCAVSNFIILFHRVQFVKCWWKFFCNRFIKGCILSSEKEKENRSFCFSGVRPRAAQRKVNSGVVNRTFGNRTHQSILGPGSGGKIKGTGSNRKYIGERSESGSGLREGGSTAELGDKPLIPPLYDEPVSYSDWSNILLLTDSRCCGWQYRALSLFNITFLQFGKRIYKTRISSKQYKFVCEIFHLSLGSKKSKKYACDLLQKEKEAFKISSLSTYKPTFKRHSFIITLLPKVW